MAVRMIKWAFLGVLVVALAACKSEFERARTSNDPEQIYKKAMAYYEEKEYDKAQALFELALPSYRGKQEAEDLYYKYAYTFYNQEQYVLAEQYFKNFSNTFGASPKKEEADFMSAYSSYQLSPNFRLEQSYSNKAIESLQNFINTYPASPRVAESNKLIDELRKKQEQKLFEEAKLYFDLKYYQAAVQTFENLLKEFAETGKAEEVRYYIVKSSYLWARNSITDKQKERFEDTKTRATDYLRKYKKGSFAVEVKDMLAEANATLK